MSLTGLFLGGVAAWRTFVILFFMQSMKTYLLSLAGLFLGRVAAWQTFVILFFTPYKDLFPIILFPIGIAAVTSFFFGAVDPERWWVLAAPVALPTFLMAALFLVATDVGWEWVVVAGVAIGVCAIAGWLGQKTKGITTR